MPFQISPGVNVSEIDLTTIIPAVSTTTGAFAGHYTWGPVGVRVLVDSEDTLVNNFGKPNSNNASDFFTAANFLSYGNALYLTRVINLGGTLSTNTWIGRNATSNSSNTKNTIIKNSEDYLQNYSSGIGNVGPWVAKYPGQLGNNLRVSICVSSNAYQSNVATGSYTGTALSASPAVAAVFTKLSTSNSMTANVGSGGLAGGTALAASISIGDYLKLSDGNQYKVTAKTVASTTTTITLNPRPTANGTQLVSSVVFGSLTPRTQSVSFTFANGTSTVSASANVAGRFVAGDILLAGPDKVNVKVASISSSGLTITLQSPYVGSACTSTGVIRNWEFYNNVSAAPGTSTEVARNAGSNDEMHVVVVDEDGGITGYANTVLEVHQGLSKATNARSENGTNIYYKDYINQNSRWIWWTAIPTGVQSGKETTAGINWNAGTYSISVPYGVSLGQGRDGKLPREADYIAGYNLFKSAEDVDISLVLGGGYTVQATGVTRATNIINNITEYRKDCVAVFSPPSQAVVNNNLVSGAEQTSIITFRNLLPSSSYAIMDSGWKYQYDKYNDVYRYVPCNGDTAGLMVRTDNDRDPWWSPAGYNRGGIKNAIKMAYNPGKADRDQLYKNGINPIVTFPGQGTILFGDKTMLSKPSAFDRINVRRLFIVLEKAIATAAKFTLFEFNDAFTRAQFKALVEPFLRDVQGRRGITDFRVVCDETNNTGEVIDRNEFVGDIYIKPARSINFIQLNFVAVRSGVDFTEVVGKF